MNNTLIQTYFPDKSDGEFLSKIDQTIALYREWNTRINVISRKDIDNLMTHHILHSLAIAKFVRFNPDARIMDLGSGGGFPGIPLALFFPNTQFILVDSILKKTKVIQEISDALQLKNICVIHSRAEDIREKFDFVICRAVAPIEKLLRWSKPLISNRQKHAIPNGLISLKGGRLDEELASVPRGWYTEVIPVSRYFEIPYFEEKYIVYVQI